MRRAVERLQGGVREERQFIHRFVHLALSQSLGCVAHDFRDGALLLARRASLLPNIGGGNRRIASLVPRYLERVRGWGYEVEARQLQNNRREVAVAPASLTDYLGRYYSEEIDTAYDIIPSGPSIAISRPKYDTTDLLPAGPDTFAMIDFSIFLPFVLVQFNRDAQQQITGFRMDDASDEFISLLRAFRFSKVQQKVF